MILGIQVLIFVGGVCNPDSFAEITQTTSTDGITLQFTLPELTISEVIRDNIRYQEVHYADCHFTDAPGNPRVPVTRLMLGIPAAATIEAVDVSAAPAETRTGVRLVPVPIFDIQELDSQHSASQHWSESGSAYQSKGNGSLPETAHTLDIRLLGSYVKAIFVVNVLSRWHYILCNICRTLANCVCIHASQ